MLVYEPQALQPLKRVTKYPGTWLNLNSSHRWASMPNEKKKWTKSVRTTSQCSNAYKQPNPISTWSSGIQSGNRL